jgi:hypothetical protein
MLDKLLLSTPLANCSSSLSIRLTERKAFRRPAPLRRRKASYLKPPSVDLAVFRIYPAIPTASPFQQPADRSINGVTTYGLWR